MDLNDEAITALTEEVESHKQGCSLSLLGLPQDCNDAMQDLQHQIDVRALVCCLYGVSIACSTACVCT